MTARIGRATRAAWALKFGTVWINCRFKQSGKDRSVYSLEEYANARHVMARL